MKIRVTVAVVTALLVITLAACAGGSGARDASPVTTTTIVMQNNTFGPPHAEAQTQTTVTWTNADQVPHDVKFDGGPQSEVLALGGTYQRVFDAPGTYNYVCSIHPGMDGRVTVVAR